MDKKKILPLVLSGLVMGSTMLTSCSKKSEKSQDKVNNVKKMEKVSGEKSGCNGKSSCKDSSSCGDGSSCS